MSNALITGDTGGLGQEFARYHASLGGDLILVGRNQAKLASLKAELVARYGVRVATIQADFAKGHSAQHLWEEVQELGWQVDILINNAGFGGQGKFIDRSLAADTAMLTVNAQVPTELMKLCLPGMMRRGHGRVLNVSSSAAFFPGPNQAEYFATKAYLTSLGNALWEEMQDTGVTVTTLMPGPVETGFSAAGHLQATRLFAPGTGVDPAGVAQAGYEGMLRGKLNVVAGLPLWMQGAAKLSPLLPKRLALKVIADLQKNREGN